jgi:hypothetical protein
MAKKTKWKDVSHADKLAALRSSTIEQIAADYDADGVDESTFKQALAKEKALWSPGAYEGGPTKIGEPPNKEVVLGAWRDLDRSEAILELIDNSIDAWTRRRAKFPQKCAPELAVYIVIDGDTGQLTYEDNAGGVPTAKLVNLVVPGHSETNALDASIGSYKTGGKKAIFRLATAVNITTHYWNPAETGDEAVSVHLDNRWLGDAFNYEFPYYHLKDKSAIEKGQTRYVMQLREEPVGSHWFKNPEELEKIKREIQKTYGLLLTRHPDIKIYFPARGRAVTARLDELYDFSGSHDSKIDIRPQRVKFDLKLEYEGLKRDLSIEVVIGCRITAAIRDERGPGFDLYGNDRMFVLRDERLLADLLPKGAIAKYIRGLVNIVGPNVFVPWDTHKRHLNYDRDVIGILRTHPAIRALFDNWKEAFSQISNAEVTKTVGSTPLPIVDAKTRDLAIPHSSQVEIDPTRKRGQGLPNHTFKPKIKLVTKKQGKVFKLNISLTNEEARQIAAHFGVEGELDSGQTKRALAEKAKEFVLKTIGKSSKK